MNLSHWNSAKDRFDAAVDPIGRAAIIILIVLIAISSLAVMESTHFLVKVNNFNRSLLESDPLDWGTVFLGDSLAIGELSITTKANACPAENEEIIVELCNESTSLALIPGNGIAIYDREGHLLSEYPESRRIFGTTSENIVLKIDEPDDTIKVIVKLAYGGTVHWAAWTTDPRWEAVSKGRKYLDAMLEEHSFSMGFARYAVDYLTLSAWEYDDGLHMSGKISFVSWMTSLDEEKEMEWRKNIPFSAIFSHDGHVSSFVIDDVDLTDSPIFR